MTSNMLLHVFLLLVQDSVCGSNQRFMAAIKCGDNNTYLHCAPNNLKDRSNFCQAPNPRWLADKWVHAGPVRPLLWSLWGATLQLLQPSPMRYSILLPFMYVALLTEQSAFCFHTHCRCAGRGGGVPQVVIAQSGCYTMNPAFWQSWLGIAINTEDFCGAPLPVRLPAEPANLGFESGNLNGWTVDQRASGAICVTCSPPSSAVLPPLRAAALPSSRQPAQPPTPHPIPFLAPRGRNQMIWSLLTAVCCRSVLFEVVDKGCGNSIALALTVGMPLHSSLKDRL